MKLFEKIIPLNVSSAEFQEAETLPIINVLSRNNKHLWLIGVSHTKNPQDKQIVKLKTVFETYENETKNLKRIVAYDSIKPLLGVINNIENIIENDGERGYLIYLSKKSNIGTLSIEPAFQEVIDLVLSLNYSKETLVAWAFLNSLVNNLTEDGNFSGNTLNKIEDILNGIKKVFNINCTIETLYKKVTDIIETECKIIFPNDIQDIVKNNFSKTKLQKAQESNINKSLLNKAGSVINQSRDYCLFKNIIKIFDQGYDEVFVQFGWNHVISELPAFLEFGFKKPSSGLLF